MRLDSVGPGTMAPRLVTPQLLFLGFHHGSYLHTVPSRFTGIFGNTMVNPFFVKTGVLICVTMLTIISYYII
jgi:hypothetical protein